MLVCTCLFTCVCTHAGGERWMEQVYQVLLDTNSGMYFLHNFSAGLQIFIIK